MHLSRLSLRNFKKYRRAEIEFQDGLTGIIGSNGSGKSTVVEAIAWALYGNRASTIKRDYIKNSQAGEGESVEVRLAFDQSNHQVTVIRSMKGKSLAPDAALAIDGMKVASGTREVDGRLEEMLKISFQDFMKTFYARQKDLDNLLREGGTGKREYLLKLLGLDEVRENALEKIKSDQRALEEEKSRLLGAIAEMGDLVGKAKDAGSKLQVAKENLSREKEVESELASQVETRRLQLDLQAEMRRSHDLMAERLAGIESSRKERACAARLEEGRLKEIELLKAKLAEMEPRLERLKVARARLEELEPKRKSYGELSQMMVRARAELDGAQKAKRELDLRISSLKKDKSTIDGLAESEREHLELSVRISLLEESRDKYNELQARLNGENIRLSSLEENIARAKAAIDDLESAKVRMEETRLLAEEYGQKQLMLESLAILRDKKRELDSLTTRREALEARGKNLSARIVALQKEALSLGSLESREAELQAQDLELDRLGSELLNQASELKVELGSHESRRKEALNNQARVKGLGTASICPTCERTLGEHCSTLLKKYDIAVLEAEGLISKINGQIASCTEKNEGVISARSNLRRSFEDLNSQKRKRAELLAEVRSLEAQAREISKELGPLQLQITAMGDVRFDPGHLDEVLSDIDRLRPMAEEFRILSSKVLDRPKKKAELNSLYEEKNKLNLRLQALEEDNGALGYLESDYQECRKKLAQTRPLHEKFSILAERVKEMPALEEKASVQAAEIEKIGQTKAHLESSITQLAFDPAEHDRLAIEKKELARTEENALLIRQKISSEPELRARLGEAKDALTALETEAQKCMMDLKALGYREEAHEDAKNALTKAQASLEVVRKEISESWLMQGILEGEVRRLEAEKRRQKELEGKLFKLIHRLQVADSVRGLVNKFLDQILVRIKKDIAAEAGKILEEVTGKYSSLMIDEDFNILVEDGGEFYPIWRYSGGEIDMIAVSVRVAISEHLMRFRGDGQGYSFLILDEIFGSQDMEHREKMINMLRRLDDRFPQIFAISHISDVQGQFDSTISVIEDDSGCSRVELS